LTSRSKGGGRRQKSDGGRRSDGERKSGGERKSDGERKRNSGGGKRSDADRRSDRGGRNDGGGRSTATDEMMGDRAIEIVTGMIRDNTPETLETVRMRREALAEGTITADVVVTKFRT